MEERIKSFVKRCRVFSIVTITFLLIFNLQFVIDVDQDQYSVTAMTIIVDDNGNTDYSNIQDAIDASNPGDTIRVWAGEYNESLVLDKPLTLIGNGTANTTINGKQNYDGIFITSDGVHVSGFSIHTRGWQNPPGGLAGIELFEVTNVTINNNNCSNNLWGIIIRKAHANNIINNICTLGSEGIWLEYSDNNYISENNLTNNYYMGVQNEYSNNNMIVNNYFFQNGLGVRLIGTSKPADNNIVMNNTFESNVGGVKMYKSHNNKINNNSFSNFSKEAIISEYSSNNSIFNNSIFNTSCGVSAKHSAKILMKDNVIINTETVFYLYFSSFITLKNNIMFGNGFDILGHSLESWNSHSIDETNTINDKLVGYFKNENSKIINTENISQIILANCTNMIINGENVSNMRTGIRMGFTTYSTIQNNIFNSNNGRGITLFKSNNNIIANNTSNFNNGGIYLFNKCHNNTLINNTCNSNKINGIYIDDFSNNSILINNSCNSNGNDGISIRYSIHFSVFENNICQNNGGNGLELWYGSRHIVSNNTLINNSKGLLIFYGSNITIENNELTNNEIGFSILNSKDNTIKNNNCSRNSDGIYLYASSFHIIKNNIINSNKLSGILMETDFIYPGYGSSKNIIYSNIISNNMDGIRIEESLCKENLIYNNSFIDNNNGLKQAFDSGTDNNWSLNGRGNFWSDWNEPDLNYDCIVDIPYELDGDTGTKDFFPISILTNPDIDKDEIPDAWEEVHDLNYSDSSDAKADPDQDGLTSLEEFLNKTDPQNPDTDNDGLYDGEEIKIYFTNPSNNDTDNDSFEDKFEIENDTDPLNNDDFPVKKTVKPEEKDYLIITILTIVVIMTLIIIATIQRLKSKD